MPSACLACLDTAFGILAVLIIYPPSTCSFDGFETYLLRARAGESAVSIVILQTVPEMMVFC